MSDREFTCECTASDRDNPQSEADIVDLQQTMICRFPKVCDSLLFRRWTQRYGILTNCDGYSDGPKNNHRNPSLLFRPNLLQRCTRFAHGVLRWIHYLNLIGSQRYQRKRSKEDDCLWARGASLARSWLWRLYSRCTGCCGGSQRTVEGMSIWRFWTAFVRIGLANAFCRHSHGKRSRARWSRVACPRRNFCDNNKNCFDLRQKSTTLLRSNDIESILTWNGSCWASRTWGFWSYYFSDFGVSLAITMIWKMG